MPVSFFHPYRRHFIPMCLYGHDAGLHPHFEILPVELEVGLSDALDRNIVFGHDLDLSHPLLAGKGGGMEGPGLLLIADCGLRIAEYRLDTTSRFSYTSQK